MKIKKLLSDKSKWTKGYSARTKTGKRTNVNDKNAEKFCLIGALNFCYDIDNPKYDVVYWKLRSTIGLLFPLFNHTEILKFNDDPKTTFEMVRTAVEIADV